MAAGQGRTASPPGLDEVRAGLSALWSAPRSTDASGQRPREAIAMPASRPGSGRGRGICGDPGIGRSRLTSRVPAAGADERPALDGRGPGWRVREGGCAAPPRGRWGVRALGEERVPHCRDAHAPERNLPGGGRAVVGPRRRGPQGPVCRKPAGRPRPTRPPRSRPAPERKALGWLEGVQPAVVGAAMDQIPGSGGAPRAAPSLRPGARAGSAPEWTAAVPIAPPGAAGPAPGAGRAAPLLPAHDPAEERTERSPGCDCRPMR